MMQELPWGLTPGRVRRLGFSVIFAILAWCVGRHILYWLICVSAPYWSTAPKHWIGSNPETTIAGTEQIFAWVCAAITGALVFFSRSRRVTTSAAGWLYNRMAGAIPKLLRVAIPTVIVWCAARAGIHALFPPAVHSGADQRTQVVLSSLIAYLAGSITMAWQAVWSAQWEWSEDVGRRENISPIFLRLASGITSGPFDIPKSAGSIPIIALGVLGLPVFLPWLAWRTLMAAGVIFGVRWFLGRFLTSHQPPTQVLATRSRLLSVEPPQR